MFDGDTIVRLSVWLAVLCYPAGPAGRRWAPRIARIVWTIGCAAFLVHVVSAFHVHYGWSHGVALRQTALQTAELTGRAVGGGIYANYLFTVVWLLDAVWWWKDPKGHRTRPAWADIGLHGFMLFMLFNGAVIFAAGPLRILGGAATVAGAAALAAAHARRRATR